jgi:hypothetical protein
MIMDNRKEIVEKMINALNDRGGFDDWWYNIDEEIQNEITDELVNILPIQIVSKRYYWLKADGTISNMWDEKTHKETIDDEMMEIAKQKGWSLIQINVC